MKSLLAIAAILLLSLSPVAVMGQTQITFFTDHQLGGEGGYAGYTSIDVSGNVLPAPPSGSVVVTTTNPVGKVVASDSEPLQAGTGMFEDLVIAGCTADWIDGTYTVTVALSGSPQVAATTTFGYIVNDPLDAVTVQATPQSISGVGTVTISGSVVACGGSAAQSSVELSVKSPSGFEVYSGVAQPISHSSPEDGDYSVALTAGASPQWSPGTYTVSVFFTSTQSVGTPASAAASFTYAGNPTQSTSSSSTQSSGVLATKSTTLSATALSTSSASSAQSTASSAPTSTATPVASTTKGSGAPLIPYVVAIAVAAGVAGSFVGLRGRQKAPKT